MCVFDGRCVCCPEYTHSTVDRRALIRRHIHLTFREAWTMTITSLRALMTSCYCRLSQMMCNKFHYVLEQKLSCYRYLFPVIIYSNFVLSRAVVSLGPWCNTYGLYHEWSSWYSWPVVD